MMSRCKYASTNILVAHPMGYGGVPCISSAANHIQDAVSAQSLSNRAVSVSN